MELIKKIKALIKVNDFFYSSEMLRYNSEMEYKTLTGGFISLGIIITIVIGFASIIIDTFNLNIITTNTEIVKHSNPPSSIISTDPESMFMFAVQIWTLDLSDIKRYFDVTFRVQYYEFGLETTTVSLPLQACTPQHWSKFPQVADNFDSMIAYNWLCPPMNGTYNLLGKLQAPTYSQYVIQVSACKNQTDPLRPCAPHSQIQQLFLNNTYFYFDFYFTNPIINPNQKNYKKYYLQDSSYALFGQNLGSQTILYFTDYTINTDYSIWPFIDMVQDKGCIVQNLAVNHPYPTNINGTYVSFSMVKSPNSIIYNRQVQKISSILSFMGGMISAISAVLFIIKVYTSFSFQISIGLQIFKDSKNTTQNETKSAIDNISMNFFNFIKYYFFKIANSIGKPIESPVMRYIQECHQEILCQLDIKSLIKRLVFIQYCITILFQDYQLDGLQINKPKSPSEIKKIREKCQAVVEDDQDIEESDNRKNLLENDKIQNIYAEAVENKDSIPNSPNLLHYHNHLHSPNTIKYSQMNSKVSELQCQNSQLSMQYKNSDTVLVDQIPQVKFKHKQSNFKPNKCSNSIRNSHNKQLKRNSYLSILKANADEGNQISKKIWGQIQLEMQRNSLQHHEQFS